MEAEDAGLIVLKFPDDPEKEPERVRDPPTTKAAVLTHVGLPADSIVRTVPRNLLLLPHSVLEAGYYNVSAPSDRGLKRKAEAGAGGQVLDKPGQKRRKLFGRNGPIRRGEHYLVDIGTSEMEYHILQRHYCLCCDDHMSGKTSVALDIEARIPDCHYVTIDTLKVDGNVWDVLADELQRVNPQRFQSIGRAIKDEQDFLHLVLQKKSQFSLIIDEGDRMARVKGDEREMLVMVIKRLHESVLDGCIILGSHNLPEILSSKHWPEPAPTRYDAKLIMGACKLQADPIKGALEEWCKDNKECVLEPSVQAFADDIFRRARGNAGVTGFCLAELTARALDAEGNYTVAQWSKDTQNIILEGFEAY